MKKSHKEPETKLTPLTSNNTPPSLSVNKQHLLPYLSSLLDDLEYIEQFPKYHPEGNALYHSLQVYQLAKEATDDPELWAAALLHDVGKTIATKGHEKLGREMLQGLLSPKICWLVEHHLHLLTIPKRTRKRLQGTTALHELEQLRCWDLGGRKRECSVPAPERAISSILEHYSVISSPQSDDIYSRLITT
ncbi:MAG: HD domain-containing protein [Sedimenticola sp.]